MRLLYRVFGGLAWLAGLAFAADADVGWDRTKVVPAYALASYAAPETGWRDLIRPEMSGGSSATRRAAQEGTGSSIAPDDRPERPGQPIWPRMTPVVRYDQAFLDALPGASGDAEWECLARAIYFEARGEAVRGQFAVGEVIMNRVASPLYPGTICRVVNQGGSGGCQFSFVCDGLIDRIREKDAFATAGKIARLMLDGAPRVLTDGATHFHTRGVRPGWAHRMPQTASIGQHMFYRIAAGG